LEKNLTQMVERLPSKCEALSWFECILQPEIDLSLWGPGAECGGLNV
jgi:hypothetical protein